MPAEVPIKAAAERLRMLGGWHRWAAAFAAGAASVLAMAPFFAWPVLWLTLPALVWLIDGTLGEPLPTRRRAALGAAAVGWWFGFGYFLAGLFWVGEAFLVEAEVFAWLLPLAVTLLPGGLALFWAAAAGMAAWAWRPGASRVLVLAVTLSAMEWARGHVFTGLPWNVLGYALSYPLAFMQSAGVLGIYGWTVVAMLVFALPAVMWSEATAGVAGWRLRIAALALALGPIGVMGLLDQARLLLAPQ